MTLRTIILTPLLAAISALTAAAQVDPPDERTIRTERRTLAVDVLTYPSDSAGRSRADIYVEVPYTSLQFVNQGGFFRASYELVVTVGDSADRLITERVWSDRVEVDSLQEIRIRRPGEIVMKSLFLEPGRYRFAVKVRDLETDRATVSRLRISIPDYGRNTWAISDAMLLKEHSVEEGRRVITPNIPASVSDLSDSFSVFFNLYDRLGVASGRIVAEIVDRSPAVVLAETAVVPLRPGENALILPIPCGPLGVGEYTLRLSARPLSDAGPAPPPDTAAATTERTFTVRWIGAPIEVTDVDAAIDQMQYIADRDLLDEIKALPAGEKRDRWAGFWSRKDPTPGTERNELMEEYYSRVEYATRHFGHYTVGWKTDMGMVYIIFGPPSAVERRPFEIDSKPYEVWTYYELNRQFLFVDATGFGDYRLQTPIWDVHQTRPR